MSADILVTGGTGLLGYALREICPEAVFLSRKDGDLTELSEVRRLFNKHQPRNVIHLAAKVGGVKMNAEKNADMFSENILINTNVLKAAQESGVQKLVGLLSSCIFQNECVRPYTSADVHAGQPYFGHIGYASSKRMMDLQIHLLNKQYGAKYTTITPATLIGPNDNFNLDDSHVASALIQKCHTAKQTGTALEVWGSGRAVRQMMFSYDAARILLEVLKKYDDPDTLISVPDDGVTVKDLAETIARVLEFRGPIRFDTSKPEGQLIRVMDGSKFRKTFPDFKFTALDETIRKTYDWFLKHIDRKVAI